MDIETSQSELRRAYLRGGPGAMVSGVVWCIAGIAASASGVRFGFAVLFFGGMLIFPVAKFIVGTVLRREPVSPKNPGGITVIETVFPMIAGLLAAWLFIPYRQDIVFPLAAIAVGAHYFGFRTAYGDWTNWIRGGTLCLVGAATIVFSVFSINSFPFVIGAIEMAFGCWLTWISYSKDSPRSHSA